MIIPIEQEPPESVDCIEWVVDKTTLCKQFFDMDYNKQKITMKRDYKNGTMAYFSEFISATNPKDKIIADGMEALDEWQKAQQP